MWNSATACPPAGTGCRVHAIRLSLDELPLDARDERPQHHPHVGHIPGKQRESTTRFMPLP